MHWLLLPAFLLTLAGSASVAANVQVAPSSISPAREAAERFLAAMNGPGSTEAFVASSFTRTSLEREPAAARAAAFDRLKSLAGGFQVLEWRTADQRMAEVLAVSKRGSRHAKIVLFTSAAEPGRITNIFVLPERDPVRAARDAFPAAPVSEQEVVRLARRRLDSLSEEGSFSGGVLIARGDKVLLRDARGLADRTWSVPNRIDTKFNLASVSKMWTAVVIMKLVEQGKLSLDDTLARWVPSYPHPDAAAKISLRDLLRHTGGIGDWDIRKLDVSLTPGLAAATMTAAPRSTGGRFAYSNAGYVLLGAAAEAATGRPYEQLVDEFVFQPAGMKSSGFWPVTAVVPNRATGYLRPGDDPLGFGPAYSNEQFLGFKGDASGGAYSTLDDMFAFHRALATGRLLNPRTVALMMESPVEMVGAPRPARYGLGLRLEECSGKRTLGHSGGGANSGVSSATFATVDGSWTVIVLGNTDPMPEQVAIDLCGLVHRQ